MNEKDVLVIGSLNIDKIYRVDSLPQNGETIQASNVFQRAGGKGLNQAVAVARSNGNISLLGGLGEDEEGEYLYEVLRKENISAEYIKKSNMFTTGEAIILVDKNGENIIITYPGANRLLNDLNPRDDTNIIRDSKVVLMHWDINSKVGEKFILESYANNTPVLLNLAPVKKINKSIFDKIEILIVNEIEAFQLTNIKLNYDEDVKNFGNKLINYGCNNVIVTLGEKGAYVNNGKEDKFIEAPNVKAVDTTAAGDTFLGYLANYYTEKSIFEATNISIKAASVAVTKMGAVDSIPYNNEIISSK